MNDVIKLLPDSVANQIAAGEVIQRPASVIKELVENAVDAGAKCIKIILRDAGKTLIQVVDDGTGMSDTDARLAFERHATSKIRQAADLFELHTMGFRGEALPSIVAVSQVELTTMRRCDQIGTRLCISASRFESQEPEACAPGTSLMVKNLFFNFPARRKFLKKDSVELSHIMHEFERLTLVNPHLEFLLVHNDVTLHQLMAGSLKQRIASLFGKALDKQLIPVDTETPLVKISGFVGLPANARKRNALQYFFVNGRNMRHPYFHKAVMQCYEHLIPADEQPNYFINLHVDPETIDVNIHPTKNEIKFENEQAIWQILSAAIRDSLGRFNAGPAIDFDVEDAPEIPVFSPDATATHELIIDDAYNPFARTAPDPIDWTGTPPPSRRSSSESRHSFATRPAALNDWEKLYDDFMRKRDEGLSTAATDHRTTRITVEAPLIDAAPETVHADGPQPVLQLNNTYIITPARDGLMVIDQHRAHLRVLYDSYLQQADRHEFVAQATMFPDLVELSAAQNAVLNDIAPRLRELGFILTYRGETTWSIDGIPSIVKDSSPRDLLLGMIETVTETGEELESTLRDRVALTLAKGSAISRGRTMTIAEMDRLVSDLFRLHSPALTPEGKTVFTILPLDHLAHMLG